MYVDSVRKQPDPGHDWALLPGNHSLLLPAGFAVSAGTQQPELAYDLVKYMTSISALAGPGETGFALRVAVPVASGVRA